MTKSEKTCVAQRRRFGKARTSRAMLCNNEERVLQRPIVVVGWAHDQHGYSRIWLHDIKQFVCRGSSSNGLQSESFVIMQRDCCVLLVVCSQDWQAWSPGPGTPSSFPFEGLVICLCSPFPCTPSTGNPCKPSGPSQQRLLARS